MWALSTWELILTAIKSNGIAAMALAMMLRYDDDLTVIEPNNHNIR